MNISKRPIICIFGPTGVGKSGLAEEIAAHLPAEIINMDVGQFYTPLSIGTAKPAWQKSSIPHHLFDIIHEPRHLNVIQYRDLVLQTIADVSERNKIPILVGGSGFYLLSLFFPPRIVSLDQNELPGSWQDLYAIDPERARKIHPNDTYRIQRALAIVQSTGFRSSLYQPHFQPFAPFILVEVLRERADLYDQINKRTQLMIQEGWIEEVERLLNTEWEQFMLKKKLIGYDTIIHYLRSPREQQVPEQLIEVIARKTRHYAKRQITFGKMLTSRLQHQQGFLQKTQSSFISCNLTLSDIALYLDALLHHPLLKPYNKG